MADRNNKGFIMALIDMTEIEQRIRIQDRGAWEKILMEAPDSILTAMNINGGHDTKKIFLYVKEKLNIKDPEISKK
jgi:hypothetical protein